MIRRPGERDPGEAHAARGERAGLVEQDRVHAGGAVERLGPRDEDPPVCAPARADEDRHGRGEAECARAGDDEHRDRGGHRLLDRTAGEQPGHRRHARDHDDDGHEDRRDAVGEPLRTRLAELGLLDQGGDVREPRVGADPGGAHHEATAVHDRRSGHRGAGRDVDRRRLAREHALVDARLAVLDDAVGGDPLPRSNHESCADAKGCRRHPLLATGGSNAAGGVGAIDEDGHLVRREVEQRAQRRPRAALRPCLDHPPEQEDRDDAGGDLEVDVAAWLATDAERPAVRHPEHARAAEPERPDRPRVGGERAERDEGVHRQRAVPEVDRRGAVERPAAPGDDGRREHERHPLPAGELQRGRHREHHDRQGEQRRDDEAHRERIARHPAAGRRLRHTCRVPRGAHRVEELVDPDGRREPHARPLGREVHLGVHAVEPFESTFDPGHAARTGHALDVEVDRALVVLQRHPCPPFPSTRGSTIPTGGIWCKRGILMS